LPHVCSGALQSGSNATPANSASPAESGHSAVFTALGGSIIQFCSFSVHAATGGVGILLDRGLDPRTPAGSQWVPRCRVGVKT